MESAIEEIEFLALSPNRVRVLELLAEQDRTRRELSERTDASQPTLGRILRDFQDRAWITRDGSDYRATATGRLVADGFTDLVDIVETERKLRDVVTWLPADALGFDLRHLSDATITVPSRTRPNAPVQRILELLGDADRTLIFSHAFNEQSLEVIQRAVREGTQTFRGVISPAAIDALAGDSRLRESLQELIAAENATVRLSDDEIPLAATVADDVIHLLLRDENGILRASVDTDDPAVLAWAEETHERYWERSSPLDETTLAERTG
jgi:predicted transcriptional regulator